MVYGVGLCIILFDVTFVGDPYVIHGTGAAHTRGKSHHSYSNCIVETCNCVIIKLL